MHKDSNQIKKRITDTILYFIGFLLIVLGLHYFGKGSPMSWKEILINLPMLVIVYLIVIFIRG